MNTTLLDPPAARNGALRNVGSDHRARDAAIRLLAPSRPCLEIVLESRLSTFVEDKMGFGPHSDQERILESEFHRFVRFHDAVADLVRSR